MEDSPKLFTTPSILQETERHAAGQAKIENYLIPPYVYLDGMARWIGVIFRWIQTEHKVAFLAM